MPLETPHNSCEPPPLRGICIGAGYFSQYHHEAWNRIPEVEILACCDRDLGKAQSAADRYGIPRAHSATELEQVLDAEKPDFVDVITPPETHLPIVRQAAKRGIAIICQKPLAPTFEESKKLVETAVRSNSRLLVHENWRWQPWYREIKRQLEAGAIGELHSLSFQSRLGDGWAEDAYLARQPYFRELDRFLVQETGVHFLDTIRFLAGEVDSVYARLQKRNASIKGEDACQIMLGLRSGATALIDLSRYNESEAEDPRYTFGEVRLDGSEGHLELALDGSLTLKRLGEPARNLDYKPSRDPFAGDCVYALQHHFAKCMLSGQAFESAGKDYLKTIQLVEACYQSNNAGQSVSINP